MSDFQEFEEMDLYNGNKIAGVIYRESSERYGALEIRKVNDLPVEPQFIYCTPKLKYPFGYNPDGERVYHFPKCVKVKAYEKLDGTNICSYSYQDASGRRFVTFKTRLVPVLKQSRWGDFKAFWDEILARYPQLREPKEVLSGEYAFSYELFGYRNPHLIVYTVPLETQLLFAVRQKDGGIVVPDHFKDFVPLPVQVEINNTEDLVKFYNDLRAQAQAKNKLLEEGNIEGTEGSVLYVLTEENKWQQFKLKPEIVEALHWTTDSIPFNMILATAWNAIESDDLNVDGLKRLLKEEFSDSIIEKSGRKIEKAVEYVTERVAFRAKVAAVYQECGLTFAKDGKTLVMRKISAFFNRNEMGKVFAALKESNLMEAQ